MSSEPKEPENDESMWGQLYGEEAKQKQEEPEAEAEREEEEEEEESEAEDESVAIVLEGGTGPGKQGSVHMKKGSAPVSEEQYEEEEPKMAHHQEAHPFSLALPNEKVYDIDIDLLPDKPWRKPGADLTDYFNYGFNEVTWRNYCKIQIEHRLRDKKMAPAALPSEPEHPVPVEMEPQVKVPLPRRKENDTGFRGVPGGRLPMNPNPAMRRERSPRAEARGGNPNLRRFQPPPMAGRGFERPRGPPRPEEEDEEDDNYNSFEKQFPSGPFTGHGGFNSFPPNGPDNFPPPKFTPNFAPPGPFPPPSFTPNFTPNFAPNFAPNFQPGNFKPPPNS